jgi:hypothetical protein
VTVGHTKVRLGKHKARTLSNKSHLVGNIIGLDELNERGRVHTTYENNIKIGIGCGHIWLLRSTTSEISLVLGGKGSHSGSLSTLLEELSSALGKHIFSNLYIYYNS